MKKLMQSLRDGKVMHIETTAPAIKKNEYLIRTTKSLISTGTEKMLLEFGKSSYFEKALQQPEKVKQTIQKIKTDGLSSTIEAVNSKLDQPIEMGYCNVGIIEESFSGGLPVGTRVISNGSHSSYVVVPKNLVAKIPDNVSDEQAVFTIPGSIALQSIRLFKPDLGETIVVFGLGLIGLLTVQILRANGCNVYGIDLDREKCEIAEKFGAKCFSSSEDYLSSILTTNPKGIDGVIISASAKTNEIIEKSAELCRKRGRIILVGVVGLNLDRSLFYEKELSFQVSCSYGPGRYNKNYEEKGLDYPIEFVRWTENRNFYAVLDLMSQEKILTKMLITANFSFDSASDAYDSLKSSKALGLILDYDFAPLERTLKYQNNKNSESINKPKVSFIGAGNYASRVLMPAFSKAGFDFVTLQTKSGISANKFGKKFNFKQITTDEKVLLSDNSDLVVIATRHDLHCDQVCKVLENKKNVFVEKPLALNSDQLNKIKDVYKNCNQQLIVGFNRRFSPHIEILKNEINKSDSLKSILLTMNAGTIEDDHWTQDKEVGGGRIIGEACHYIDLLIHLLGDEIDKIEVSSLGDNTNTALDTAVINIKFKSGSIGAINYISNGSKSFPKERIEVFFDEKVIQVDNFKSTRAFGLKGFKNKNTFSLQKGQNEMAKLLYSCLENGKDFPIQINEIFTSAELSIKADSML